MNQIEIILIFLLINFYFLLNFDKIRIFNFIVDKPDKLRKFHKKPTALAGGIILFINIIIYYLILSINKNLFINEIFFSNIFQLNFFFLVCILIFLLGFIDDKYNLNPIFKFIFLSVIIGCLISFDPSIKIKSLNFSFLNLDFGIGKYSFLFTLFCFLVFLNAFNMFDGINLQASSYSLIIFIYFFLIAKFSLLLSILIIFILSFKYLNYYNKSFLGDNGSLLISFIIIFIFIKLFNENFISYSDQILIIMIIPGIDMIRLFFERIKNKKNTLSFDRMHLHHLLIKKFSHSKTILIINGLILTPIIMDYLQINRLFIIILTVIFYGFILLNLKKFKKS